MTETRPTMDQILDELVETFDLLGDWESRIEYVIDLGRHLAPLAEADRIEANKVPGCAAQVWLATRDGEPGRLRFMADSDSAISKGNIALLLSLYDDRTPQQILAFDAKAALDRLGLDQALTRQRANGLYSMVGRIRQAATPTGAEPISV
jgi:SufE protein probably involved in Fe-S center assembly